MSSRICLAIALGVAVVAVALVAESCTRCEPQGDADGAAGSNVTSGADAVECAAATPMRGRVTSAPAPAPEVAMSSGTAFLTHTPDGASARRGSPATQVSIVSDGGSVRSVLSRLSADCAVTLVFLATEDTLPLDAPLNVNLVDIPLDRALLMIGASADVSLQVVNGELRVGPR